MTGCIVSTKRLYVVLAKRREERKAHLIAQYMQRISNGVRVATVSKSLFLHVAAVTATSVSFKTSC